MTKVVGSKEEAKKVVERTKSEEVKKLLSANTEKAFKDGAFGMPYFVGEFSSCPGCPMGHFAISEEGLTSAATNENGETENFWGVDHMGQLCDHLGLEKPNGKGWRALL